MKMTMTEMLEEMSAKFEELKTALEEVDYEVNGRDMSVEYHRIGNWRSDFRKACESYDYIVTELGFKF